VRYYPSTVTFLRAIIEGRFGPQVPGRNIENLPTHLIWMMEEMQTFPDTRKGSAKAGRWIGWMCRAAEEESLIDNTQSRVLIKKDVGEGHY